jgi:hypothetical protein
MFYDGPDQPEGIFDDFLDLLFEVRIIVTSASFLEFLKVLPASNPFAGKRSVITPLLPSRGKLKIA